MVRAAIAGVAFLRTFRIDNSLLKRTVQRSDRTLIQPRTRDSSVLVRDVAKQHAETAPDDEAPAFSGSMRLHLSRCHLIFMTSLQVLGMGIAQYAL